MEITEEQQIKLIEVMKNCDEEFGRLYKINRWYHEGIMALDKILNKEGAEDSTAIRLAKQAFERAECEFEIVLKKRIDRRIEEYKLAAYVLNEDGKC